MPKLSIIVPIYNVEAYLAKCIDSILQQSFEDFELLLIDDGSPDNCGSICDKYATQDKRVRVIHKKNGGLSDARNVGIQEAKGEYISLVDSDDWIKSDTYSIVLEYMQKEALDICCFNVVEVRNKRESLNKTVTENKVLESNSALEKILTDKIDNSACDKIYKLELWENVSFPKGRSFEDVATTYKVFYKAVKIGCLKEGFYYYLKRPGSIIALSFDAQKRFDCFKGYMERLDFALQFCHPAVPICKMFAVKAALSCVTALEAGSGNLAQTDETILYQFLDDVGEVEFLNNKYALLLWGVKHCRIINYVYANISLTGKKLGRIIKGY